MGKFWQWLKQWLGFKPKYEGEPKEVEGGFLFPPEFREQISRQAMATYFMSHEEVMNRTPPLVVTLPKGATEMGEFLKAGFKRGDRLVINGVDGYRCKSAKLDTLKFGKVRWYHKIWAWIRLEARTLVLRIKGIGT